MAPDPTSPPEPEHGSTPVAGALLGPEAHARALRLGRAAAGVLMGAVGGGIAYLVLVEAGHRRGFTDIAFNHSLGVLIGGEATEGRAQAGVGVVGDTAAPVGLGWFTLIAIALVAIYGLTCHRLPWHWTMRALPFAVGMFLLISLVYMPLIEAHVGEVEVGAFGLSAGGWTPVVFALGSLAFSLMAARIYTLSDDAAFWIPRSDPYAEVLKDVEGLAGLEIAGHDGPGAGAGKGPGAT